MRAAAGAGAPRPLVGRDSIRAAPRWWRTGLVLVFSVLVNFSLGECPSCEEPGRYFPVRVCGCSTAASSSSSCGDEAPGPGSENDDAIGRSISQVGGGGGGRASEGACHLRQPLGCDCDAAARPVQGERKGSLGSVLAVHSGGGTLQHERLVHCAIVPGRRGQPNTNTNTNTTAADSRQSEGPGSAL